jgi:hypothetical protein
MIRIRRRRTNDVRGGERRTHSLRLHKHGDRKGRSDPVDRTWPDVRDGLLRR